ncbi:MAG: C39 family peptidase [Verrucomicrobiae bacterium]|nr:C39 family peptidase [Verrucomicrobiae bacterium]
MKASRLLSLASPLGLAALFLVGSAFADDYRDFTNTAGKSLRAKLIKVEGAQVTIQLESGQEFTIAANTLSAADQTFIKEWKPAMAEAATLAADNGVSSEKLNEVIGNPLFANISLWDSNPKEVAERLSWPRESETSYAESYRAYPKSDYRFFGARPYSAALYGEEGKVSGISLVFANKGDSFGAAGAGEEHFIKGKPVPGGIDGFRMLMANDAELISTALTGLFGESETQRFGDGETRTQVQRWDWNGHAFLLSNVEDEYVGLTIQTTEFADKKGRTSRVPESIIRQRAKDGIEQRENGDIILSNLPMVDQGPKGYCAPATVERCMRYLGIPADMYLLAMVGETSIGGGTNTSLLLENIGQDIKRKGRKFDSWRDELKIRTIKKYIDDGIPIMWGLFSTEEFNDIANRRSEARKELKGTEFASYAAQVKSESETASLPKDTSRSHIVIIIGYNETTNEIAFSDSWGERFTERWISLPEAAQVSQDYFYVIDL